MMIVGLGIATVAGQRTGWCRRRSSSEQRAMRRPTVRSMLIGSLLGMVSGTTRRGLGWMLVILCLGTGLFWFHAGTSLGGLEPASSQCSTAPTADRPTKGGPYYENTTVTGWVTYFPLAIVCTYDSPDDSIGPQTVHNQNWAETVVCLLSLLGVGLGVRLAIDGGRIAREKVGPSPIRH